MAMRRRTSSRKAAGQSVAQLKNIRSRVSLAPEWWTGKTHILIDMDGTLIGQPGATFHNLFAVFAFLRLSALASYSDLYRAVNKTIRTVLSNHQFANNEDAFFETLARELNVTRQKLERFAGRFFDSDYPFICLFLHSEPPCASPFRSASCNRPSRHVSNQRNFRPPRNRAPTQSI